VLLRVRFFNFFLSLGRRDRLQFSSFFFTLPYSNFLEKNFWGFVCVLECRRHARVGAVGTTHRNWRRWWKHFLKFLFYFFKKMTSKRNFFKCVGNFSRPFACRNRSQKKKWARPWRKA
jgi:hypothetical protein